MARKKSAESLEQALNDDLPPELGGPTDPVLAKTKEVRAQADEAVATFNGSAPLEEETELARILCSEVGDNPDNFRNGRPRWQAWVPAARQHLAAFDYLATRRGVQMEDQ